MTSVKKLMPSIQRKFTVDIFFIGLPGISYICENEGVSAALQINLVPEMQA